jgi:hypothetical protein
MCQMAKYYVHYNGASVFVKEAGFFKSQGGLTDEWGKHWRGPLTAESIHAARMKGYELFNVKPSAEQRRLSELHERRPLGEDS